MEDPKDLDAVALSVVSEPAACMSPGFPTRPGPSETGRGLSNIVSSPLGGSGAHLSLRPTCADVGTGYHNFTALEL